MGLVRVLISLVVAIAMGWGGYKKRSLNFSGSIAAVFVGSIVMLASIRCGVVLIAFFITSSLVTKVGKTRKRELEENFQEGGQRSWVQVFANSPSSVLCLIMLIIQYEDERLFHGFLAQLAAMQGDTWASELGILSSQRPVLITTLRPVPPGTNGGITLMGTGAAVLGGFVLGLALLLTRCSRYVFGACILYAFLGTMLDSFLGAQLQYSGYDKKRGIVVSEPGEGVKHISGVPLLDNHAINFLTSLLMTAFGVAFSFFFINDLVN